MHYYYYHYYYTILYSMSYVVVQLLLLHHPTPYTLHPTPLAVYPTPYTVVWKRRADAESRRSEGIYRVPASATSLLVSLQCFEFSLMEGV